jgi:glucosamine-6-phosphate deaminase
VAEGPEQVRIVPVEDRAALGRKAAEIVVRQLQRKANSVITLPTGNTPLPLFRELVTASKSHPGLFQRACFVTLDEYADIAPDDRRRLLSWLKREFLDPAGIGEQQITAFDPSADDRIECRRLEQRLEALGGLDLAVLGLGPNGHLGFNEPDSSFDSRARKVALAPDSIISNSTYWGREADVPTHGLTLGLGTLREARAILVLVSGRAKSHILSRLLSEPIGENIPASMLRLCPQTTIVADRQGLSLLPAKLL